MLPARLTSKDLIPLYDRWTWTDSFWSYGTESKAHQWALALFGLQTGDRVLEIAFGSGLLEPMSGLWYVRPQDYDWLTIRTP